MVVPNWIHSFILFLCLLYTVDSRIAEHEILSLPGWSGPLPTRHYSGYLSPISSTTKKLFYWFVESENDSQNDPVVLWLSGGPGCSSLSKFFKEVGPLLINSTTSTNAQEVSFIQNPHTLNRIANILFLESPIGVGLSYSPDEIDYITNDSLAAIDHYGVLISFFQAYPEYSKNDFYVGGIEYAEVTLPLLMSVITQMNNKVDSEYFINLKGFLIGGSHLRDRDECHADAMSLRLHTEFYYSNSLISKKFHNNITTECRDFQNFSKACLDAMNDATRRMGKINIFNIYKPCINILELPPSIEDRNLLKQILHQGPEYCFDNTSYGFLNSPLFRRAIHAEPVNTTGEWEVCATLHNYTRSASSLLPIYKNLAKAYRGLIYTGDSEALVPWMGYETWTKSLNLPIKEKWRHWNVDEEVAGYVTKYDHDFYFLIMKGAGHEVGQDRPEETFAMFERFLKNMPF